MFFTKRNLLGDTNNAERHSFIVGHRARTTSLNRHTQKKHTNMHHTSKQKKNFFFKDTDEETWLSMQRNIKLGFTHARLGSLTLKRVWNESRACFTVGRLLTHAWTPVSSHGPFLWYGRRCLWGWWKTISCVISHSVPSLTRTYLWAESLSSTQS